ncbi:6209_t:CDS:1 [Acaulospora morrowiae]|uniref:6209_t:CDS:1 n=1 Tax=Acaulospora morrowiae TaxID=94023 RepID=A0A9N9D117_9GLOM|nr:6209_t:CDS:1 [Acaulospora morrowiae]
MSSDKRIFARDVTTIVNQPTSSTTDTTTSSSDNKLNSSVVVALIVFAIAVLAIGLIVILIIYFRRRKKDMQSRGLKPFYLNPRIEPDSHKGSRTRRKSQVKIPQYDQNIIVMEEEGKEEPFEESYAEGAVGKAATTTHSGRSLPVRSQTMYGTTTPSSSTHYPVLQQHHFMSSDHDDNNQHH